jgi:heat shock protein HslJ
MVHTMTSRRTSALATLSAALLVAGVSLAACGDDSGSPSADEARATASSLAAAASSALENAQGAVSSAVGAAQSAASSAVAAASSALASASSSIFSGELEGSWVAGAGLIEGVVADQRPTLDIAADGTVSGFAGCNQFNGDVTVDGASLEFGPLATTRMACGPVATKVETEYLAALEKVASYSFVAGRLLLQDADGNQVLIFDGV